MSPEFESRRQRREAEILAQVAPSPEAPLNQQVAASQPSVAAASLFEQAQSSFAVPAASPTPSVQAPLSRRELRIQQSVAAPTASPASYPASAPASAPESSAAPASVPEERFAVSESIDDFQLRISKLAQAIALAEGADLSAPAVVAPPVGRSIEIPVAPATQTASSRREMRQQLRANFDDLDSPTTPYAQPWTEVAVAPMFETSSGFSLDTTTNSIVLPVMPDALPGNLVLEQGVTIKTGSIELPNLNTATGSITVATAAQIADEAMNQDSVNSVVTDISPVAASNLLRNNPRMGLAPVTAKNAKGQLFYVTTTSILMLTVGGLLVAAWMFGFIK